MTRLNDEQRLQLQRITQADLDEREAKATVQLRVAELLRNASVAERQRLNRLIAEGVHTLRIPKMQITKAMVSSSPAEVYNRLAEYATEFGAETAQTPDKPQAERITWTYTDDAEGRVQHVRFDKWADPDTKEVRDEVISFPLTDTGELDFTKLGPKGMQLMGLYYTHVALLMTEEETQ